MIMEFSSVQNLLMASTEGCFYVLIFEIFGLTGGP